MVFDREKFSCERVRNRGDVGGCTTFVCVVRRRFGSFYDIKLMRM